MCWDVFCLLIFRPLNLQAVTDVVDQVIEPIKYAMGFLKVSVDDIKEFFNNLKIGRRLEETIRAHRLKEQAHRQLAEVRGRLLHARSDHVLDGIKERLRLDINQGLEAHFAERKRRRLSLAGAAAAGGVTSELISIKKLSISIPLYFYSRLLIETDKDELFQKELVKVDFDKALNLPLVPTPFYLQLGASFNVNLDLQIQLVGDFKALLEIKVDGLGLTFDLSTNADEPVGFSFGDLTHTIT